MKQFIKSLVPPILFNIVKKLQNLKYGWKGNYSSWKEAQDTSTGYDSDEILQTVKNSLLKVKNGEAVYERDSVIFNEIQYSWPLLTGLMFAAAKSAGSLKVLDFGGSLGSTYYQNKKFLDRLDDVSWSIVEQKHFVETGKKDFENDGLKFYYDVHECIDKEKPNVLLLSSVLQYIENPYELLDSILENNFEYILIDRTPFCKFHERIKLQVVSDNIFKTSVVCRFFDEVRFVDYFKKNNYSVIVDFSGTDGESSEYIFKGMIMEKSNA